mmetsp:Transcript_19349/g.44093  ORF Transcript_19349/g.44093 Transcript_19349/m.44093 type:complete len:278 (-) Transcript_19349:849-1682(-)
MEESLLPISYKSVNKLEAAKNLNLIGLHNIHSKSTCEELLNYAQANAFTSVVIESSELNGMKENSIKRQENLIMDKEGSTKSQKFLPVENKEEDKKTSKKHGSILDKIRRQMDTLLHSKDQCVSKPNQSPASTDNKSGNETLLGFGKFQDLKEIAVESITKAINEPPYNNSLSKAFDVGELTKYFLASTKSENNHEENSRFLKKNSEAESQYKVHLTSKVCSSNKKDHGGLGRILEHGVQYQWDTETSIATVSMLEIDGEVPSDEFCFKEKKTSNSE